MPDISLWNKCNNKCIMCTNSKEYSNKSPYGNYDIKTQIKKLRLYLNGDEKIYISNWDRKDYINITGGEPTLHPHFFTFIKYIRKELQDIPITLLTNGRAFSDEKFTQKFVGYAKQPFIVAISFHTYDKKKFEKITKVKNSYIQTIQGILNLKKYFNGTIEIRIVIHKKNIDDIEKTLLFIKDLIIPYNDFYITIIHYEIEGMSEINKKKIFLRLTDSSSALKKIEYIFKIMDIRLYHFPLCVLSKRLQKYAWITLCKEERIYTKKCEKCLLKRNCLGLMKRYYEIYGDNELKPVYK